MVDQILGWSMVDQSLVTLQRITAPSKALCSSYPTSNPSQSVGYHYSVRVKTPRGRIKSDEGQRVRASPSLSSLIHQKLGFFTWRHHPCLFITCNGKYRRRLLFIRIKHSILNGSQRSFFAINVTLHTWWVFLFMTTGRKAEGGNGPLAICEWLHCFILCP